MTPPICEKCGTPYDLIPATGSWVWRPVCGCAQPCAYTVGVSNQTSTPGPQDATSDGRTS